MGFYDFKQGRKDVLNIINSKTPIKEKDSIPSENEFTFENGMKTWVASLFVDIVDSTKYFQNNSINKDMLSRIIRSFVEQIVIILNENESKVEIGIRGDCVYAIFDAQYKETLLEIFRTAYCINTFLKMFKKILSDYSLPILDAGIGLGCGYDLIVKAGEKKITNDKIWIGDAVFNASNLSKIANRNGIEPICMDSTFYNNIIELLKKENHNYSSWVNKGYSSKFSKSFYECDIVQTVFNNWIDDGMKDE